MHLLTASVQGSNKRHDVHRPIYQKWIPPTKILSYYGPTQPEQYHGTTQEPLKNASSTHSNLGGGNHGLIAIIIGAQY